MCAARKLWQRRSGPMPFSSHMISVCCVFLRPFWKVLLSSHWCCTSSYTQVKQRYFRVSLWQGGERTAYFSSMDFLIGICGTDCIVHSCFYLFPLQVASTAAYVCETARERLCAGQLGGLWKFVVVAKSLHLLKLIKCSVYGWETEGIPWTSQLIVVEGILFSLTFCFYFCRFNIKKTKLNWSNKGKTKQNRAKY